MTTSGSVAWIVNLSSHDYTPVKSINGISDVRPITEGYVSLGNYNRILETIRSALDESMEDDFLLLSGLPVLNVMAALQFISMHGVVNLLTWDKKYKTYRKFSITLEQLQHLEELKDA